MTQHTSTPPSRSLPLRFLLFSGVVILVLGIGLVLDLRAHGLVWQFFWSQTGEEAPVGQIRGMVELMGNAIRAPLNTAPLTPIQHTSDIPYGVNTFLQKEVEEPKLRAMLTMIKEAGIRLAAPGISLGRHRNPFTRRFWRSAL
jgi:hypothetical protein